MSCIYIYSALCSNIFVIQLNISLYYVLLNNWSPEWGVALCSGGGARDGFWVVMGWLKEKMSPILWFVWGYDIGPPPLGGRWRGERRWSILQGEIDSIWRRRREGEEEEGGKRREGGREGGKRR